MDQPETSIGHFSSSGAPLRKACRRRRKGAQVCHQAQQWAKGPWRDLVKNSVDESRATKTAEQDCESKLVSRWMTNGARGNTSRRTARGVTQGGGGWLMLGNSTRTLHDVSGTARWCERDTGMPWPGVRPSPSQNGQELVNRRASARQHRRRHWPHPARRRVEMILRCHPKPSVGRSDLSRRSRCMSSVALGMPQAGICLTARWAPCHVDGILIYWPLAAAEAQPVSYIRCFERGRVTRANTNPSLSEQRMDNRAI